MVGTASETTNISSDTHLRSDEILGYAFKSWNELFGSGREEVEAFQLRAIQRRFEELRPRLPALADNAERAGVDRIDTLDDVVPLLFDHPEYKSYPISLIEKNRFPMLTRWLQRLTTVDLSHVDTSECTGIDEWMATLEREAPIRIYHTSGTSGKLSFLPRSVDEAYLCSHCYTQGVVGGFGDEPHFPLGGSDTLRMPVIYPSLRNGRFSAQRFIRYLFETVAPTPQDCYTLSNGTLSADLISLSGRIRMAQSKGGLANMTLTDSQRVALARYMDEQERQPSETADFFKSMIDGLRGRRVLIFSQSNFLYQAAVAGLEKGISKVFAPDSIGYTGGGSKDIVLPPNWQEVVKEFTGIENWVAAYGMSELLSTFARCPQGHYHIQPHVVPFLLDPETSEALPREGVQTGRFAAFDLLAHTYWGGLITGDRITIEWDSACACGRKGVFVHDSIERYSAAVTGDDKVTCAAKIDNTDTALKSLLGLSPKGIPA